MPQHSDSQVDTPSVATEQRLSPDLSPRARPVAAVHRFQNVSICHLLSSSRRVYDDRAFYRQAEPASAQSLQVSVVAPHGVWGSKEGVELIPLPRANNRLLRIVTSQTLIFKALRQRATLYHFHDPELIPVGLLLKILFRKKVVYDAREDYPAMMLNKVYIPKPLRALLGAALSRLEALAARALDGIITADPFTLRRLARLGPSKKLVFYNFPSYKTFPPPPRDETKPFDLVYSGGLSERCGSFLLLDAVQDLIAQGRTLRLLLIGYFDDERTKELVERRIRTLGLEGHVELCGTIPHDEMARRLSRARIGVCPLQATAKFLHNIPVKVFEYWACGLPVVASDLPPIRPFFRNHELGLLFKPGDARELSEAIGWLLDHPTEATRMGMRGRRAVVERYNNRQEAHKLLSFYQHILQG